MENPPQHNRTTLSPEDLTALTNSIEIQLRDKIEQRLVAALESDRLLVKQTIGTTAKICGVTVTIVFAVFALFGVKTISDIRSSSVDVVTSEIKKTLMGEDSELKMAIDSILTQSIVSTVMLRTQMGRDYLSQDEIRRLQAVIDNKKTTLLDFSAAINTVAPLLNNFDGVNQLSEKLLAQIIALAFAKDEYSWILEDQQKLAALFEPFTTDKLAGAAMYVMRNSSPGAPLQRSIISYLARSHAVEALDLIEQIALHSRDKNTKRLALSSVARLDPGSITVQTWLSDVKQEGNLQKWIDALWIAGTLLDIFQIRESFSTSFDSSFPIKNSVKYVNSILTHQMYQREMSSEFGIESAERPEFSQEDRNAGKRLAADIVYGVLRSQLIFSITPEKHSYKKILYPQGHPEKFFPVPKFVDDLLRKLIVLPGLWPEQGFLISAMRALCYENHGECSVRLRFRIKRDVIIQLENGVDIRRGGNGIGTFILPTREAERIQVTYGSEENDENRGWLKTISSLDGLQLRVVHDDAVDEEVSADDADEEDADAPRVLYTVAPL